MLLELCRFPHKFWRTAEKTASMEGGESPRRQSPRKKSLAEIKAEARKKMLSNSSGVGGSANSSVLVEDPDATALAAKVKTLNFCQ